ncbi:MAG: DNA-3-methyladenine glycosylase I [Candidatus Glassbacteria bacterium]|nr:DNA-3-methyladenine glycosylase I [Candidatus Glassbacteria bacterium]
MKTTCAWVPGEDPLYKAYHDSEWGVPVHDDRTIFEFLTLESAQAGLSWITILRKRENYRAAFSGFDPEKVARYDEKKFNALMGDAGLIRNKLKIRAAIDNAQRFLEVAGEFGTFDKYIWGFVGGKTIVNSWKTLQELPVFTPEAEALSKDLKRRGFKFVGPTVVYSHMQATGMVLDHTTDCFRYKELLPQ